MRPSLDSLAGAMALVVIVSLSGPGVKLVHAEEPLAAPAPPAPVCSADPAAPDPIPLDEALIQHLQRLRSKAPADQRVVVLDTRGYGYDVTGTDLESIRRELMRIQRETR